MKVKIGDSQWLDSEDLPICIELSEYEKELIQFMGEQTHFAVFPNKLDNWSTERKKTWMKDRGWNNLLPLLKKDFDDGREESKS